MSESGHAMVDHGRTAVEPTSSGQLHDAVHRRALALPTVLLGSMYLLVYVLLDWISSIEHYGPLVNNSWNPNTGASIAVAIIFGQRMIPFMFIAPLLGDLVVRQFPFSLGFELASTVLTGSVYGAAALFLLHSTQRFDRTLESISSLALLTFTTAVSTALVAVSYVGIMVASGLLPAADFAAVAVSYWVGDAIGIMVLTPFALIMWTRPHVLRMTVETLLQLIAILAAVTVVHAYWTVQHLQLFYLLFVPVVWMAVRAGIEGTCVGILVIQLGFILGFLAFPEEINEMPKIQAFMLVLASTGLFAGTLVTERRRTEAQLGLHQASLSRLVQLGSMGELAAALAHELNQPLMAAGTYTRLVDEAIRTGNTQTDIVAKTAKKAATQVERAAEVVRRLRALVRLDRSNRVACQVDQIVREAINLCRQDLDRLAVRIHRAVADDLPPVMVDMLQIEQVVLNLVRNSIDAIGETGSGTISIKAVPAGADLVEVQVRDSGPGFPSELAANPFLPLLSTKKEGLGFGLPLCRSLIEANGGKIWLGANSPGAAVHFTLPIARRSLGGPSLHG